MDPGSPGRNTVGLHAVTTGRLDKKTTSHCQRYMYALSKYCVLNESTSVAACRSYDIGMFSSTLVRQQKRRNHRNRSSIFVILDRP